MGYLFVEISDAILMVDYDRVYRFLDLSKVLLFFLLCKFFICQINQLFLRHSSHPFPSNRFVLLFNRKLAIIFLNTSR